MKVVSKVLTQGQEEECCQSQNGELIRGKGLNPGLEPNSAEHCLLSTYHMKALCQARFSAYEKKVNIYICFSLWRNMNQSVHDA